MSRNKNWDRVSLEDLLRVDPFGQQIYIVDPRTGARYELIRDNREFFTQIYAETLNKDVEIVDGSQVNSRKMVMEEWIQKEIGQTENSLTIFIEGYAGCGKSTFVQYLLSRQLRSYNYEYQYYNYDIGANSDDKQQNRINSAIREGFILQLIECITHNKDYVIDTFKVLISQDEIKYLDPYYRIYNEFANIRTFDEAINIFKDDKNKDKFRSSLHKQLKNFSCAQILALDYLFRLSNYIKSNIYDNPILYVCYDNLDSIENNKELKEFANVLISMRKNIDDYINVTSNNYSGIMIPRFVIISTYRKITAAKVESFIHRERIDDYSEYNQYIQYIDASHFYSYYDIVEKREKYFSQYIKNRRLKGDILLDKLHIIKDLIKTEFVRKRYAGLWNNNYRTCSTIFDRIFKNYYQQAKECEMFINKEIDGYDETNSSYYGSSAIFLSLVCKIFHDGGMWGEEHMNLIPLNNSKEDKSTSELTSLSRLILTFMSNYRGSLGNVCPVPTIQIFNEFSGLFTPNDICRCLANMLARDKTDTWRRPIYYHRNPINDDENIEAALIHQWEYSIMKEKNKAVAYTELLLCECGYAFIERLSSSFEYFSNRISNDNVSLYLLQDIKRIEEIVHDVYESVKLCCDDMITFCGEYMKIKDISKYDNYIQSPIHPRTYGGKPQVHTERIIFSHISYLNYCRLYHINSTLILSRKIDINEMFVLYISKYLNLYTEKIKPISSDRLTVAEGLGKIIQSINEEKIKEVPDLEILFQSISIQ